VKPPFSHDARASVTGFPQPPSSLIERRRGRRGLLNPHCRVSSSLPACLQRESWLFRLHDSGKKQARCTESIRSAVRRFSSPCARRNLKNLRNRVREREGGEGDCSGGDRTTRQKGARSLREAQRRPTPHYVSRRKRGLCRVGTARPEHTAGGTVHLR